MHKNNQIDCYETSYRLYITILCTFLELDIHGHYMIFIYEGEMKYHFTVSSVDLYSMTNDTDLSRLVHILPFADWLSYHFPVLSCIL